MYNSTDGINSVEITNVEVVYNNGYQALKEVSFSLNKGVIAALVGINGSGKSTLFKAIMGFVPLANGEIRLLGLDTESALRKNLIAYVPQNEEIDWDFPILVEDVVMMGRYGHMNWLRMPKKEDFDIVLSSLERVGMSEYLKRQIGELSGGQKKRVFLARALAQKSEIILLDEPFTGIDVRSEEEIVLLLSKLREEGKVILIATHNLGSVPEFCNQSILINKTIIASGETSLVFTQSNLELTFGGALRQFILPGKEIHTDKDDRGITVLTDDERPLVFYDKEEKK
ncbi:ATP-binding cassette domain-containing protein [bacterium]|jgi:manganese/iron transport system ATP-binding protein|nr:ATP-binding cassette domain-containing protein [bacterium]MBT3850167.1 ATP-binding cassette domain-containing protein [bacterium]MDG2445989.1 ATP-binding cassette domain-containing protein [Thermodesulfobacteriota bacterium]NSW99274.1 ATP-binding cassette domain-containing protein [bacterium]|tara:strand:- start:1622 stop:2476 length:855 start_codon:yes stop_codon:yes gene_type:complete